MPLIAGSFTGWRYRSMMPLHEFCRIIDKENKPTLEIAKLQGELRKRVEDVS